MRNLLFVPFMFLGITCFGQSDQEEQCGHAQMQQAFQLNEPEAFQLYQQARLNALQALEESAADRSTPPTASCPDGIRIIPIYVHVLHNGGDPLTTGDNNFTIAEIQSAINRLNMHYQGSDPWLSRVQDEFWANGSVSANTCIQFCWNQADVNRVDLSVYPLNTTVFNSQGRIIDGQDEVVSPPMNKCQFLNLYTGRFGLTFSSGGGLLGYALNLFHSAAGVRIDDNIFVPGGAITNPSDLYGVTTSHEVGHYLGLNHIWGDSNISNWNTLTPSTFCSIDDGMSDTPNQGRPASGPGLGVPTYVQNEVVTHCDNTIMWTNFMDYSSKPWTVNFTSDQAEFMRLWLTQAENLLTGQPSCNTTGGFLNGETKCIGTAIACASPLAEIPNDTLRICGTDTINLNQYIQNWTYNNTISPSTEYTWREGNLFGSVVDFPAKTIVSGNSPVCTPDTIVFSLNMKCASNGMEQLGGRLIVLSHLTPEQLLARYLKDGDCENGPGPVFSAQDLEAGCDELMDFVAQSNPVFPTTVSGEIIYEVSFDSLVVGPCCSAPCTRMDTAEYRCGFSTSQCPGIAFSGGNMINITPCPDFDFDDAFEGYETNLISLFDPNGYVNDVYYFSNPERTTPFDPITDYTYDGDGCHTGSNVVIYTALGCDTDQNGIPNGFVSLGTVTMSDPVPFPTEPTITFSVNGDSECLYEAIPGCSLDDVTPAISLEICGASDLPDVTLSVLSEYGCEMEFTVAKPDCPSCEPPGGCPTTTFAGGSEIVCSGDHLLAGFPDIELIGGSEPFSQVLWTNGPIGLPWVQVYPVQPFDLPDHQGPVFLSDPTSGLPSTQIYFAYTVCDHDGIPATPAIYLGLGEYEVTVEPVPHGRVVPVCLEGDSLNFYTEVQLFSNPQSNTYTATNTYDATSVTFTAPGTELLGPFPNGTDVSVNFAIDNGCSFDTDTFNLGCLTSSCSPPEFTISDTCVLDLQTNELTYWIAAQLTGSTSGYLFEITNDVTDDTTYASINSPLVPVGPFTGPQSVTVTVTDYTNPSCSAISTVEIEQCEGPTSLIQAETFEVLVYPNPATESITYEILRQTALNGFEIEVFDVLGQMVLKKSAKDVGARVTISLLGLDAGLYLTRIGSGSGEFTVLRFTKL